MFLAGKMGDDDSDSKSNAKESTSKDDDSDLDEDAEASPNESDDEDEAEDDDDSDLDDEDEKSDKKVEPETAKRLEQVRRTDKRLREQREAQFKARESELKQIEANLEQKWSKRIEAAEEFERLKSRRHDPVGILKALGYDESDFADIAREAFSHSPLGSQDPKNKEAVAQSRKERELRDEMASIKKQLAERDSTEKKREEESTKRRDWEAYQSTLLKAVTDKTPLAKAFLDGDADAARSELSYVAGRLYQELDRQPSAKEVAIAFEKAERARLRRYGIDPKSLGKAAATTDSAKATTKTGDKKAAAARPAKTDKINGAKPLTKEDFIRGVYD